jgi:O-antigen/teichoic acid export membrane protein
MTCMRRRFIGAHLYLLILNKRSHKYEHLMRIQKLKDNTTKTLRAFSSKGVNWRGEMSITMAAFAATAAIKLVSALILTRLLYPEAYGLIAMIGVVAFVIELISDIGIVPFLIRHHNASEPNFLHTIWTVRLVRSSINFTIMFLLAPLIAEWYATPALEMALQLIAFTFLISSMESMSFLLAVRNQRSRIVTIAELGSNLGSVTFTVIYSYYSRDHYGMVFGMLVHRCLVTIASYMRQDRIWPKLRWDKTVVSELFGFAKFVGPSSTLSIFINQFDKVLILKLFDLKLLGLYGVAGSVSTPVNGLIGKLIQNILYPRMAQQFRNAPNAPTSALYLEHKKLLALIFLTPAALGGFSTFIIETLFDSRYYQSAWILQAFFLASILYAIATFSETILIINGHPKSVLIGNVIRCAWLVCTSYVGYSFFGFSGFVFAVSLNSMPVIFYFWSTRKAKNLVNLNYELAIAGIAGSVWFLSWLAGKIALSTLRYLF